MSDAPVPTSGKLRRRSRWLAFIGVMTAVVTVMGLGLWRGGCNEAPHGADAGGSTTQGTLETGVGEPGQIRGQVLLEVASGDDAGEGDQPPLPTTDTDTGGEPAVAVSLEPASQCTVWVWRAAERVGGPVACGAEGRFEVDVRTGVDGALAVDIVAPGRLRAVLQTVLAAGEVGELPPVALGEGHAVQGEVVDDRGRPITDARIDAMPMPDLGEPVPWRTTTDSAGAFRLDTLPIGPVAMRVLADGFEPVIVEAIAPQDELHVVLQGLVPLRGRVVGPTELAGRTRVRIEGSAIWPAIELPVAADGTFVSEPIPIGVYGVEAVVQATESETLEFASVPLENVSPDQFVTVVLTPGFRIPVQVVGPDGVAVAGARVLVGSSQLGLLQRAAETDSGGLARPGPVVVGTYVVRVDAAGYLPSDPQVVAVQGADVESITVRLMRAASIRGIVVDERGRPVAAAKIAVEGDAIYTAGESQARAQMFEATRVASGMLGVTASVPPLPDFGDATASGMGTVTSDSAGAFVLEGVLPGRYTLAASHPSYAGSGRAEVTVKSGQSVGGVRLVLRPGEHLSGWVLDANRQPIEGAWVAVNRSQTITTDARGYFDAGMWKGRTEVVVRADAAVPERRVVQIEGRPVVLEFVLADATAGVHGRVEDRNGQPVADVDVLVQMLDGVSPTQTTVTDRRGLYRFEGLPEGAAELTTMHPDYVDWTRTIQLIRGAIERVDVRLAQGWAMDIVVRDGQTRQPIARAVVSGPGVHGVTGRDGVARLKNLTGEQIKIAVEAPGYASARATIRAENSELVFNLIQGGGLSGKVIDYRGDPMAAVEITVLGSDGAVLARSRSDAGGDWVVHGIPEGDVVVEALAPSDRSDELADAAQDTDVLRGRVTRNVVLRFDRR